ncbi:glycoside hydrolase family 97 protein [Pedobacter nyackensis]|uniref:Alpha-glucosidase n=1 Tax=Pedobacter nyackensis TaxID=475255 RepID=A0A1W2CPY1_9SPHI|nr:glycoside hydrolase family 97 protein [Pedobacter nyackensis]SMC87317.1 alpha-glucosidase [Pedobacter nyackensis]
MKTFKVIGKPFFFLMMFTLIANISFSKVPGKLAELKSPDGKLQVVFTSGSDGSMCYSLIADGKLLLKPSRIGLNVPKAPVFEFKQPKSVKKVWRPVWGKRSLVNDTYREIAIVSDIYTIKVRAYNDGIAFRYEDGHSPSELTEFNFAGNYTAWYYNGENHNIGPEKLQDAKGLRRPVVTIKAAENQFMAIHEANLESGEQLLLQPVAGSASFQVPSKRAKAWRVIMYGRTPGQLVDSHLLELLNPEPESGYDFSWVKPGVALWDWRINGAEVNGFKYQMSLPSWKRMIDFAGANKIPSLVLDANWYGAEFNKDSDPLKGGKAADVKELIKYGKERGVGVWLYLNDVGGKAFPIEAIIKQYGDWGAVGIKYGFMSGSFEEKNIRTRLITKLCAQNHLMVDYHDDPVHPYGQMRTWPNAVTREFCFAQLDGHHVFDPKTFVTTVFVNMLAGPLDMNNGVFDMEQKGRVDYGHPVPSTIVAEAARTLITFSGATIIPDIPEYYNKHPELFKFITAEKMPWKESKTLSGEIGEYIVMARKASTGKWLIGAATNESARVLRIPLSFLEPGMYKALIIKDGKNASYLSNKEEYVTVNTNLTHKQFIDVELAPGGGACVLLEAK